VQSAAEPANRMIWFRHSSSTAMNVATNSLRLRLRGKGQITLRGLVRTIAPAKGKLWEEDASWQA